MKNYQIPSCHKEKITKHVIVEDDLQFIQIFTSLSFHNTGTTRVIIDGCIVVDPDEQFIERPSPGKIIYHEYDIQFVPSAAPPVPDSEKYFPNNKLVARVIQPENIKEWLKVG